MVRTTNYRRPLPSGCREDDEACGLQKNWATIEAGEVGVRTERDQGDIILRCPDPPLGCGEIMIYNRKFRLWECSRCGSEWNRDGKKLRPLEPEQKKALGIEEDTIPVARPVDMRSGKPILSYGYVKTNSKKSRASQKSGKRRKKPSKKTALHPLDEYR